MMSPNIINRYDQTEISAEFAELTDNYLRANNYKPLYWILLYKVLMLIAVVLGVFMSQYFKKLISESYYTLLLLVAFFVGIVIIFRRFEVTNGEFVGEYKINEKIVRYELTYTPNSTKCAVVEVKDFHRRQMSFNYNELVDRSGKISELQFIRLLKNFIGNSGSPQSENN